MNDLRSRVVRRSGPASAHPWAHHTDNSGRDVDTTHVSRDKSRQDSSIICGVIMSRPAEAISTG